MSDVTFVIRLYRPEDRANVFRIAAETAFFGAAVEAFIEDRRALQDAFVAYYTDCEPEHVWVAEVDGAVAGYVSGSAGGAKAAWGKARIGSRAALGFLGGHYRLGLRTWRYLGRAARAVLAGEFPHPDLRSYPAHLHINLAAPARGQGLGQRLLDACLDQMTALNVPGIHLSTTSLNIAAVRLYEKAGFELLGCRRTRLWEAWLPGVEVDNRVYGKRL